MLGQRKACDKKDAIGGIGQAGEDHRQRVAVEVGRLLCCRPGRRHGRGGVIPGRRHVVMARRRCLTGPAEMHQIAIFILLAQKDQVLDEREMQQGRKQPGCKTGEDTAGQHTLDHGLDRQARSVAGEAGRVAHVMRGVVQRRRLRMARQEKDGGADEGDEGDGKQARRGFGGGLVQRGHIVLLAVTPDGDRVSVSAWPVS